MHTKPRRPTSLRILGRDWKIDYKSNILLVDGIEALGTCDVDNMHIIIKDGQPLNVERDTILHEALHALWHVFDLGASSKEERAVTCIAAGLHALMADNRNLHLYLFGD